MWNNIAGDINLERLREPLSGTPSSLLLNWEAEFQKWKVDIPFYNLNNKDFSSQEEEATVLVFGCLSHAGRKYPHLISLVKLKFWDEKGHIAQNEQSLLWQALRKVETEK
ncbi:hypothetical protein MTR67_035705 [Solanum verrucosum]|uniref:Uncharacterized protein n=1 Tax=Solanum verrucosum TaxID=315347 RepID=A0AAF0ZLU2_SOLVR|nr:hypothetical protein MTR67_035705 [Solanum verrucosum]